jgi:hypothetical protein
MNPLNNSPWKESDQNSPWNLVWEHKKLLKNDYLISGTEDLFLYLENDMLFTQDNLDYWLSNRNQLNEFNLIPSFLRVEFNSIKNSWVAIDQFGVNHLNISSIPNLSLNSLTFVQLPNPYSALFLLDYELASEYIFSDAFDMEKSRGFIWWDKGARASMGVQFLNVPEEFESRHVIGIIKDTKSIASGALVHHLPNLYCRQPKLKNNYPQIEKLFYDEEW